MTTKILMIGVIKKDHSILLRKKPDGSPPYKETWYLFGAELTNDIAPEQAIIEQVRTQAGIDIKVTDQVGWDTEIKQDIDGVEKRFIYLDSICEWESGELIISKEIEKIEWVPIEKLGDYDHVPPSRKLLIKLGYLS